MNHKIVRSLAVFCLLTVFARPAAALPLSITEEINGEKVTVTFERAPQRAVSLSQFSTEMLLALGLRERMVGTAFLEEAVSEKVKRDYEAVPVLAEKWPSLEVFLAAAPDFAVGWGVAFSKKGVEAQSIISKGVKIFIPKSTVEFNATMDTLMDDFVTLGKIFGIEDDAEKYVARERDRLEAIGGKISNLPVKTFFLYDSGDTEPFTVFEGFTTNLLKMGGAHNILSGKGVQKTWGKANWEDVIAGDPDYFIIVEYDTAIRAQTDWESKIDYIKNNPRLQGLKAVKNEAFIRVRLADICPGIRNVDFLESLIASLHDK
jgi:iron complex transport system substrate-binding protein